MVTCFFKVLFRKNVNPKLHASLRKARKFARTIPTPRVSYHLVDWHKYDAENIKSKGNFPLSSVQALLTMQLN